MLLALTMPLVFPIPAHELRLLPCFAPAACVGRDLGRRLADKAARVGRVRPADDPGLGSKVQRGRPWGARGSASRPGTPCELAPDVGFELRTWNRSPKAESDFGKLASRTAWRGYEKAPEVLRGSEWLRLVVHTAHSAHAAATRHSGSGFLLGSLSDHRLRGDEEASESR
jgi:hypothetical protein